MELVAMALVAMGMVAMGLVVMGLVAMGLAVAPGAALSLSPHRYGSQTPASAAFFAQPSSCDWHDGTGGIVCGDACEYFGV